MEHERSSETKAHLKANMATRFMVRLDPDTRMSRTSTLYFSGDLKRGRGLTSVVM
jgi:hypothetical protein